MTNNQCIMTFFGGIYTEMGIMGKNVAQYKKTTIPIPNNIIAEAKKL